MNCPKCGKEMENGSNTFMGLTGFHHMLCSFTPESEKGKGLFKRKTIEKTILEGQEAEGFYCKDCDIVMPVIR